MLDYLPMNPTNQNQHAKQSQTEGKESIDSIEKEWNRFISFPLPYINIFSIQIANGLERKTLLNYFLFHCCIFLAYNIVFKSIIY